MGGGWIDLGGMGDPLLDVELERKLMFLKTNHPRIHVAVTSTCHALDEVRRHLMVTYVDTIKISNYGFSKESYESIHRGNLDFNKVKYNIESFLSIKNRPRVIMSFLELKENQGEMEAWKTYWENKCDEIYIWKPHNWAGEYSPVDMAADRKNAKGCGRPGRDFTIRQNGDVTACCFDFNHQLKIGNLLEEDFDEIVNGSEMKRILEMHRTGDFWSEDNLCQRCDQIYDRKDALVYSSNTDYCVGKKTNSKS